MAASRQSTARAESSYAWRPSMTRGLVKKRVLILIVAYNAERTIQEVIRRIPRALDLYETEVLIIDDSSADATFGKAHDLERSGEIPFPLTVLHNPVNQRYGGNQKIGFQYAMEMGFDIVALLHGDGQYKPECLPELLEPLIAEEADAVFGSRMMGRLTALKGGMPLYKYVGNRILTKFQNLVLETSLSEFHSGYRLYSVKALRRIPFARNTNDFHFDTEIIIQLLRAGLVIKELPIPTYYGDEICHVNGMKYAWNVVRATLAARAQDLGILYERKFDLSAADQGNPFYQAKLKFESPHTMALARIPVGSAVADVGCGPGYISRALTSKRCRVTGIDQFPPGPDAGLERFEQCDLNDSHFPLDAGGFDYILLLDIVEHLRAPERFLDSLRESVKKGGDVQVILSTGNIGFIVTRLALLLGWFNYGPRGILDLTHTRLFTFHTARALLEQSGYRIKEVRGVPAPFPLAFGDGWLARTALFVNRLLIRVSRSLFSYQIFIVATPMPTLEWLLSRAHESRNEEVWKAAM
jgi:glycosyltransferase involved in cell wall biosynthesis/2-polyprenyl-3-methyl-5-hydroxy-6-metoxy-1,4-benzoquinol methylase